MGNAFDTATFITGIPPTWKDAVFLAHLSCGNAAVISSKLDSSERGAFSEGMCGKKAGSSSISGGGESGGGIGGVTSGGKGHFGGGGDFGGSGCTGVSNEEASEASICASDADFNHEDTSLTFKSSLVPTLLTLNFSHSFAKSVLALACVSQFETRLAEHISISCVVNIYIMYNYQCLVERLKRNNKTKVSCHQPPSQHYPRIFDLDESWAFFL